MQKLTLGQHQVYIYDTTTALQTAASEHMIIKCAEMAQQAKTVSIALSGGSTPIGIYQNLVNKDFTQALSESFLSIPAFPWSQALFFFGDERYVPHDDTQSNYRMASESFLKAAAVDDKQIHPIPTHCEQARLCAQQYVDELGVLPQQQGFPVFDYMLLGMGDDGHSASLFPETDIIENYESAAAAVFVEKLNSWRISLTFPVLNQARVCCVLAAGEAKAPVLAEVLQNKSKKYPIGMIDNPNGVIWFIDKAAASQLTI